MTELITGSWQEYTLIGSVLSLMLIVIFLLIIPFGFKFDYGLILGGLSAILLFIIYPRFQKHKVKEYT